MPKLMRILILAGAFTLLLSLIAATPRLLALAANTTCNGHATSPGMGGPYTVVCQGDCPVEQWPPAECAPFTWTEGTKTKTQCTCGGDVPMGDTECFFTLVKEVAADGTTTYSAECVNFNCAAPKTCVDSLSGVLGGGPWVFRCKCK